MCHEREREKEREREREREREGRRREGRERREKIYHKMISMMMFRLKQFMLYYSTHFKIPNAQSTIKNICIHHKKMNERKREEGKRKEKRT